MANLSFEIETSESNLSIQRLSKTCAGAVFISTDFPFGRHGETIRETDTQQDSKPDSDLLALNQFGFQRGKGTIDTVEKMMGIAAEARRGWSGTDSCVSWTPSTFAMHLTRFRGTLLILRQLGLASPVTYVSSSGRTWKKGKYWCPRTEQYGR